MLNQSLQPVAALSRRDLARLGVAAVILIVILTAILGADFFPQPLKIDVGSVATADIVAPRPLEYVSQVRTKKLQDAAREGIDLQYDFTTERAVSVAEDQLQAFDQRVQTIDQAFAELLPFPPEVASEKLLSGQIQAAIMLTSWDSPVVRKLVAATDVDLVSFPRTDAYVALYPFLNKLVLPTGVGDLATNRPPRDVILIAPKASLVVRRDLHPAIQYLLLDAASEIHGGPGIFNKAGQFPAAEATDLPLSNSARQYYKSGRPFLQRYLPFWLGVLVGQLLVLAIPVVGVLYPMLRLAPALYGWGMRRRIFRLYGQLKFLELELDQRHPEQDVTDLAGKLDRLEARANHLRMPAAFAHLLYTLRMHMNLVRARIEKR
jgi:hypothetical protein